MSDGRKFQPVAERFEDTYSHYHGGGMVAVVLRIAEVLNRCWHGQRLRSVVDPKANNLNPLTAGLHPRVLTQD